MNTCSAILLLCASSAGCDVQEHCANAARDHGGASAADRVSLRVANEFHLAFRAYCRDANMNLRYLGALADGTPAGRLTLPRSAGQTSWLVTAEDDGGAQPPRGSGGGVRNLFLVDVCVEASEAASTEVHVVGTTLHLHVSPISELPTGESATEFVEGFPSFMPQWQRERSASEALMEELFPELLPTRGQPRE